MTDTTQPKGYTGALEGAKSQLEYLQLHWEEIAERLRQAGIEIADFLGYDEEEEEYERRRETFIYRKRKKQRRAKLGY